MPRVASGACYAVFAYDVGPGIHLEGAAPLLRESRRPSALEQRAAAVRHIEYRQPPLRWTHRGEPVEIAGFRTLPEADLVLYDFGAVSVTYRLPLSGPLEGLAALSSELYENPALFADSRRRVSEVLGVIAPAVTRPRLAGFVEDYWIFHVAALDGEGAPGSRQPPSAADLLASHRPLLAGILRSETRPLAPQEVEDALASRIAYGEGEEGIVDWNAALFFQPDIEEVRSVLEYANVELLELRWLDDQLDQALDRSWEALAGRSGSGGRWRQAFPLAPDREIRRVAELQMDSAMLFEGVSNALKLVGDQYLARLYRLAAQRMRMAEWHQNVLRRLQVVESIYEKLSDQAGRRRLEVLEWIIIVLIGVSIATVFL